MHWEEGFEECMVTATISYIGQIASSLGPHNLSVSVSVWLGAIGVYL